MKKLAILFLCTGILAGCAGNNIQSAPGRVVARVADRLTEPIFGLSVRDANTTLKMVEESNWTPEEKFEAAKCPLAVIETNRMREELIAMAENVLGEGEGDFRGVIYYATKRKYGGDPRQQWEAQVEKLISVCGPLAAQADFVALPGM